MSFLHHYNDPTLSSDDDSEYTVAYTPTEEFPRVSIHSGDEDEDEYFDRARMMAALQEAMGIPASAVKHESRRIDLPNGAYRIVTAHSFQRPPEVDSPLEQASLSILQLDKERARAIVNDREIERSIQGARIDELRASNLDVEHDISDVRTEMQLLARAKVMETRDLVARLDQVDDHLRVLWGLFYNVFVAIAEDRDRASEQRVYVLEGERLLEELSVRTNKARRDYDAAKWWKDEEEKHVRIHAESMGVLLGRIQASEQNILMFQEKLRVARVGQKVNGRTRELSEKRERDIRERETKAELALRTNSMPVSTLNVKAHALKEQVGEMNKSTQGLKDEIAALRVQLGPRLGLEKRQQELTATLATARLEVPKLKEQYAKLKEDLEDKLEDLEESGDLFRHNQAEYKRALVDLSDLEAECQSVQMRNAEIRAGKASTSQVEKRNLVLEEDTQRAVEELGKAREEEERVRGAVIKEGREAKNRIVALRKELAGLKGRVEHARRKVNVWEARGEVKQDV
ncbi:hypothetical protein CPB85DRAFT_1434449 [Mucidula mucida]|nr:hypothetical protein CPB85DRAFT_1434449 [Mucidula mucida]